jgi:hypothetical protein
MSMGKGQPSISTRTETFTPRELPLTVPETPRLPLRPPPPGPADRIRERLRRWLEEEM